MAQVEHERLDGSSARPAHSAGPLGAAPDPDPARRRRARTPLVVGALAAVSLVATVTVMALRSDDDAGGGATATTTVTDAPSASSLAQASSPGSTPTSVITATAVVPATTAAPVAVPSTAAPVAPAPADGSAQPAGPSTPTAPKPPRFDGPVQELPLGPSLAVSATVATAAVGTVAVYAEPLSTPAPAYADWQFDSTTQFGTPTAFLVTGTAGDWLRVMLPTKPNGQQGWVYNRDVSLAPNNRRVVVDLNNRIVSLYDGPSVIAQSVAVVGKASTPTPTGMYYVTDLLRLDDPTTAYGPYVLATSARSDAFDFFNGGEPIVALHGTNNPSLLGSAASNGCVRLPNEVATQLASLTPVGTPVYIV